MKKSTDESEYIRWTPDPRFDVNIRKILAPLDKVNEVGHLLDLMIDNFIDI